VATILVVDDRDSDRQYLTALLEQSGHTVIEKESGASALAGFGGAVPDLVITDILMPIMDGFEFVRQLRARAPTHSTPVLFHTSAYDESSVCTLIDQCSPAALVPKGSRINIVMGAIQDLLVNSAKRPVVVGDTFCNSHLELVTTALHKKVAECERINMELREANRALQQFVYSAAHDLQEPTRNIVNAAEMLMSGYRDEIHGPTSVFLQECRDSSLRLYRMMKGLLAYATVLDDPGTEGAWTDASEALHEVLQKLGGPIADSGGNVQSQALPVLAVERHHLTLVLENLLDNALKFRHENTTPLVQISAKREGAFWVMQVTDNGIGFDPKYSDRIFRLFKRLHGPSEYPGSGVGLALCARVVVRYGGNIRADARLGQGATFSFTMPAVQTPTS